VAAVALAGSAGKRLKTAPPRNSGAAGGGVVEWQAAPPGSTYPVGGGWSAGFRSAEFADQLVLARDPARWSAQLMGEA
jgi:hypothetical protein